MNFVTADEALQLVKSGHHIYIQGSTSIPELLQDALARRGHELRDVVIYSGCSVTDREAPFCKPEYKDSFLINSLFLSYNQRRWVREGYGSEIPAFLGEIPGMMRSGLLPIDVALINCSMPNDEGYCSYGISADLAVPAVECAKIIIAQVNHSIPFCYGDALIHESKITAAVECDEPPYVMPLGEPTDIEKAIGRNVASEIGDGATLQIGVGGIPNAVLQALSDHKHLGLHTEAMTDGTVGLIKKGVIDNSLKKVMPGISVGSLAMGTKPMYDFLDYNDKVVMKDVAWTNDPQIIRQNPNVAAINSAIEVDLTGQVCADSIGDYIFSSVGGQHDFMYGGALSPGGKTFIALPSRTGRGKAKIVAHLTPGAGVVTTRFQTQFVATEHGIVYLRDKNYAQRAKALISIAHPDDREALERAACERFGYSFLRLK